MDLEAGSMLEVARSRLISRPREDGAVPFRHASSPVLGRLVADLNHEGRAQAIPRSTRL